MTNDQPILPVTAANGADSSIQYTLFMFVLTNELSFIHNEKYKQSSWVSKNTSIRRKYRKQRHGTMRKINESRLTTVTNLKKQVCDFNEYFYQLHEMIMKQQIQNLQGAS